MVAALGQQHSRSAADDRTGKLGSILRDATFQCCLVCGYLRCNAAVCTVLAGGHSSTPATFQWTSYICLDSCQGSYKIRCCVIPCCGAHTKAPISLRGLWTDVASRRTAKAQFSRCSGHPGLRAVARHAVTAHRRRPAILLPRFNMLQMATG